MFKTIFCRVKTFFLALLIAAGLLIVPAVFAQNEAAPAGAAEIGQTDIPENLLPLAKELNCASKAACAASFTANFSRGLELAEKLNIYDKEQKALAQSFKNEVLVKLAETGEEDFDQKIIEIAKNIVKNKPSLARQFDITLTEVKAAETIVAEVKKAGVDLSVCSRSAETLAREELIACLNASRNLAERADEVKTYISKTALVTANKVLTLEEALKRGEYGDLGTTADEVGMNCLRAGSPAICDEIASRFFGVEGVGMLKKARNQVGQTEEYYKNVGNVVLTAADGQTFVGKDAIKRACDNAIKNKDVAMARVCGEFAVKNGFAKQEEVDKGLKFLQTAAEKGADFNRCAQNPTACETYIPEEFRQEFNAMREIEQTMREAMGFGPRECERGAFDPEIGRKCLEGSKQVLPKLEALASQFPEARRIAEEIKNHIARGTEMEKQKTQIEAQFQNAGGPGGCRNQEECFKFCSDPQHSPECLAFGAKYGYFGKTEAAQRLETYTQRLSAPAFLPPQGIMMYPGPMTQTQQPIGTYQQPANYLQPGVQYPAMAPGTFPGIQGFGPGPECLAAIQSGDFAKAKEICAMPAPAAMYTQPITQQPVPTMPAQPLQPGQEQTQYPVPFCPQIYPVPCPTGQYREMQMANGCPVFGACVQGQGTIVQPQQPQPCVTVALPPCPAGQYHPTNSAGCPKPECVSTVPAFCVGGQIWCSSPGGSGGWCQPSPCPSSAMPSPSTCPSGQYWYVPPGGGAGYCRSTSDTSGSCSGTQVWCPGQNGQPGWCQTPPCPSSTGGMSQCAATGGVWCGTYCKSEPGPCPGTGNCPMGQYWYTPPSGGTGYCRQANETSDSCASGQVWCSGPAGTWCQPPPCPPISGSTSTYPIYAGDANSCPGFAYSRWDQNGMRYCQLNETRFCNYNYPAYLDRNNYKSELCPASTADYPASGSCPAGQYWYAPPAGGAGYCKTSETIPSSCVGGQVWCVNPSGTGGWCQMAPCSPSTVMPGSCSVSGDVWCANSTGGGFCQPPPCPSTCPSGQYWYVPPGGGAGYCRSTSDTSGSCSGTQVWCPGQNGQPGWCQTPPCPSMTCTPAGGDCCSGAPADPDCGSVPPPPTTPPPTEPPPPTTPPPPPPTEPPPPPPPTSALPVRAVLANALEQLSVMLESLLKSVSR